MNQPLTTALISSSDGDVDQPGEQPGAEPAERQAVRPGRGGRPAVEGLRRQRHLDRAGRLPAGRQRPCGCGPGGSGGARAAARSRRAAAGPAGSRRRGTGVPGRRDRPRRRRGRPARSAPAAGGGWRRRLGGGAAGGAASAGIGSPIQPSPSQYRWVVGSAGSLYQPGQLAHAVDLYHDCLGGLVVQALLVRLVPQLPQPVDPAEERDERRPTMYCTTHRLAAMPRVSGAAGSSGMTQIFMARLPRSDPASEHHLDVVHVAQPRHHQEDHDLEQPSNGSRTAPTSGRSMSSPSGPVLRSRLDSVNEARRRPASTNTGGRPASAVDQHGDSRSPNRPAAAAGARGGGRIRAPAGSPVPACGRRPVGGPVAGGGGGTGGSRRYGVPLRVDRRAVEPPAAG